MYEIILGRSEVDREKFGTAGTVYIGKQYVKMGRTTSLSNQVYLDVAKSHVVFICGKRGCLTGDTLVFTDKGYKKIKDFNEGKDIILSLNKEKKVFEWRKGVKLLSYPIKNESLYELEFEDGQMLRITEEHPLLTHSNGKLYWKIAAEIRKEDKVISVYNLKLPGKKECSKRLARLLGFLLADGTMQVKTERFRDGRGYFYNGRKARLRVINGDMGIINQAKEDLEKEFKINSRFYKKGNENCWVLESKHQKVVDRLNKLGVPLGKKDEIIQVPPVIWAASNSLKKEFIKALFSCDGFVDKNGSRIMYYSNSKKLIQELNLLLTHFSIQSRLREKKTTCNGKRFISYLLDIMDFSSIKNFEKIGFYQKEKNERIKRRQFNKMSKRKSTIYLNNALFCQKIKHIKRIKSTGEVFDLKVDKNHSFIANGIISHNSGKSYTMGVIAEGVADLPKEIKQNLAVVILDTMGIYWTMKYENQKDRELLEEWGLQSKPLDVKIYTPAGFFKDFKEKGIPTDYPFSINPNDLEAADWCTIFEINLTDPIGVLIERTINKLKEKNADYGLNDIIKLLKTDDQTDPHVLFAAENRFENAKGWGLFSRLGTPLKDLVAPGQITVLDVSCYVTTAGASNIRALVIGLVAKKLFLERMIARRKEEFDEVYSSVHYFEPEKNKTEIPLVWLIIDEAHEFLPKEGMTVASMPLITILREGRQPGISLVLASQQPGKIHTDVMTQADITISHVITAKIDTDALASLTQTYMRESLDKQFSVLPKVTGSAVILDDMNERIYPVKIRPRFTWHGGAAPTAMKEVKKIFEI